jgi:hypothetical protein
MLAGDAICAELQQRAGVSDTDLNDRHANML